SIGPSITAKPVAASRPSPPSSGPDPLHTKRALQGPVGDPSARCHKGPWLEGIAPRRRARCGVAGARGRDHTRRPTPTDPDHGVASCTRRHRRGTRRCPGSFFSLKSQSGLRQPAGAGLAQRTKAPLLPSSGSDLGLGCTTTSPEERQAISCARGWKIRPPFSETQPRYPVEFPRDRCAFFPLIPSLELLLPRTLLNLIRQCRLRVVWPACLLSMVDFPSAC
uniref:Uncharacterized protein n=1 Tax=Aegilops tauschii subsp. strangulata TaxID=200361 RepID=A0A452Z9E4_AEGTS